MIEGIVFDLWNTLAQSAGDPPPMRELAEAVGIAGQPGWVRRIERGMMLAPATGMEGALRQLHAREGLQVADAFTRRRLVERWSGLQTVLYPDALPALESLARRFRLGLCSNTQSFGLEFLERQGVWELLDASALSFEIGALKPERLIFETIGRRLGLAPDRLLMVGDRLGDDVNGARRAGLHGLLLSRNGGEPDGEEAVRSLAELPARVGRLNDRG